MRHRMNPGNAASVNQVREQIAYFTALFNKFAYEEPPSFAQVDTLLHAICMLHFFRGRAVELDMDEAIHESTMQEMTDELTVIARTYMKGVKR